MACARSLDQCIFCPSGEMTEEHLVADWVLRAFTRSRKRGHDLSGSFVDADRMRLNAEEPFTTAKVVCRTCNNGWLSRLDGAAANVLKPLVRGKEPVVLAPSTQSDVAAWIFKSALIFDVAMAGERGPLAPLRGQFGEERRAPQGCTIYAGPAPRTPFRVDGIPEVAGLALFGIRPIAGRVNLTIRLKSDGGELAGASRRTLPSPGYTVMLGSLQAIVSGARAPIVPTEEFGFARIWPVGAEPVELSHVSPRDRAGRLGAVYRRN